MISLSMSPPENRGPQQLRSPEDQDILERSTKKTKRLADPVVLAEMEGVECEEVDHEKMRPESNEGMEGGSADQEEEKRTVSYKTMLTGFDDNTLEGKDEEDLASDDEKEVEHEDKDCPEIALTKKEKAR